MGAKKKLKLKIKTLKAAMQAQPAPAVKTPLVSPLAPASFPDLPVIKGARFATVAAGVRYKGRTDVLLAQLDAGTVMAGTFTRSATRAASVLDAQAKIAGDSAEGACILVNSGNANAFTGAKGQESVTEICRAVAERSGLPQARVFTSSTGVIGEALAHERIITALDELVNGLDENGLPAAARAIMTTDTFPKGAAATVEIEGQLVQIAGIAKGSGMIAPDMATMLVYIFTDAKIARPVLQALVSKLTDPASTALQSIATHQPLTCCWLRPQGRPARPRLWTRAAMRPKPLARRWGMSCVIWRIRWCATAKGRPSLSKWR
jgi:glutamate N-acetyltransferase / amino-acid N-acetyltransferase